MGPVGFLHVWLLMMCWLTKADGKRQRSDDELHRKRVWSFGGISVKTLGLLKSMDSMLVNDVKKVLLETNEVETEASAGHVRLVGLKGETKQQTGEWSLETEAKNQTDQTVRANSAGATNGVEGSQAGVLNGIKVAAVVNGSTDGMAGASAGAMSGTEGARSLNGTGMAGVINGSIDWMKGASVSALNGTEGDEAYAKATNGTEGAPAASLHGKERSQAVATNEAEGVKAFGSHGRCKTESGVNDKVFY